MQPDGLAGTQGAEPTGDVEFESLLSTSQLLLESTRSLRALLLIIISFGQMSIIASILLMLAAELIPLYTITL